MIRADGRSEKLLPAAERDRFGDGWPTRASDGSVSIVVDNAFILYNGVGDLRFETEDAVAKERHRRAKRQLSSRALFEDQEGGLAGKRSAEERCDQPVRVRRRRRSPEEEQEGDRQPPEHYPTNSCRKRLAKRLDETSPSERS